MKYVVVFITASSKEGKTLARLLVAQKLAACVNVVPGVWSTYWWKGKQESAQEVLLVAKTKRSLLVPLVKTVKKNHSYTVPEVIALPISGGHRDYLRWIHDSLKP